MSLDPSSCDFFPPFLVKIAILIPRLLVMAKSSDFSLTQVCPCSIRDREQRRVLVRAPHARLLHTSTHQSWEVGARAGGRATNRKKCQIYGYLDPLFLAILCLARKANCMWWSTLICGCEESVRTRFPRPLSLQTRQFQPRAGRDAGPFPACM